MTKTILQNALLIIFLITSSLTLNSLKAEDASANCLVTFDIADHMEAAVGETICLPVTIENFTEIASFQFNIGWDVNQLSFVEANPIAIADPELAYNEVNPGELITIFVAGGAMPISLPDNTVMFELCFEAVGTGTAPISFLSDALIEIVGFTGGIGPVAATLIGGSVEINGTAPAMPLEISEDCGLTCSAIDVIVTGGQAPFTYDWSGPNNYSSTVEDLVGVDEGNYELVVTDSNGDTKTASFYINTASGLDLDFTFVDPDCTNPNGGSIDVMVNNGVAPYTYEWSNGITTSSLTNLSSGTYTVTVTDGQGCQGINSVFLSGGGTISSFFSITDVDCPGGDNGEIDVIATGGQFPYTYEWNNGFIGNTNTNLTAGVYEVTITDANNCTEVEIYTVSELNLQDELSANINNAYCGTNSGAIYLNVPGPIGDYDYLWSTGEESKNINNLPPASYSVTVTALNGGCQAVGTYVVENEGLDLGFTYICDNGSVILEALVFNGQEDYTFEFSDGSVDVDSSYAQLTGLASGEYSVTVTGQASGCTVEAGPLNADCAVGPVSDCFAVIAGSANVSTGGQVCIPVTTQGFENIGGIQFSMTWDPTILSFTGTESYGLPNLFSSNFGTNLTSQGILTFLWTDVDGQTSPDGNTMFEVCFDAIGATGTSSGLAFTEDQTQFEVFAFTGISTFEFFGFNAVNGQVLVDGASDPLTISTICGVGSCNNDAGTAEATIIGGVAPYTYLWTDGNGNPVGTTQNLSDLMSGYYDLVITDSNGNTTMGFVNILSEDCVWPGDTDDSGLVDNFDVLNIGLGAGTSGPVRPNASTSWVGQEAPLWFENTPNSGVNYRHIDTDGNGTIENADTLAIVLNWGEVHNFTGDVEQQFIDLPSSGDHFVTLPFYVQPDTIEPNTIVALPVILGEMDNAVTGLYGLAFTITFDPEVIVAGSAYLTFEDSWLGDIDNNTIAVQKTFHPDGRLDIGMTRMDGNNMDGFGKIADFFITIEDDIFFREDDEERGILTAETEFGIENVRLITNLEEEILTNPTTTTTVIESIDTGTEDWEGAAAVRLYPNPVSDLLQINSPVAAIESIRLYDVAGSLLQKFEYPAQKEVVLNANALNDGAYLVKIQTEKGQVVKRIIVMK